MPEVSPDNSGKLLLIGQKVDHIDDKLGEVLEHLRQLTESLNSHGTRIAVLETERGARNTELTTLRSDIRELQTAIATRTWSILLVALTALGALVMALLKG